MSDSLLISSRLQDRVAGLAGQKRSWSEIGLLIIRVEQEQAWRNDAQTYTEWLIGFSAQLNLGQSNLWRYRASVLYGLELLHLDLSSPDAQIIAELSKTSADILEVLSKISRVAPPAMSARLALDVLEQKVSRTELREIWNVFKSGLPNQGTAKPTSQARNRSTKRSGKADRLEWVSLLSALLRVGPEWIRPGKPIAAHKLINDIAWTSADGAAMAIDAVVIVRWAGTNDISLHGILQQASISAFIANSQIAGYCDDFWLLSDTHTLEGGLPGEIGAICIDPQGVTVVKKASSSGNESNVACLAKFLLAKMI